MQTLMRIIFSYLLISSSLFAEECTDFPNTMKKLRDALAEKYRNPENTKNDNATDMARLINGTGLDRHSYMTEWKLKRENQRGPWGMQGNTLVMGLENSQLAKWEEEIGKKSFGIGIMHLPDQAEGGTSSYLRVGNTIVGYKYLHKKEADALQTLSGIGSRTEATFMATEEELALIEKFISDRFEGRITYKKERRVVTKSGKEIVFAAGAGIEPKYGREHTTIYRESCGGACGSMFNPQWLSSWDAPEALRLARLGFDKAVYPHGNPKAFIYSGFRNPNVSAITMFGIDRPAADGQIDLTQNFMENNSMNGTRGIMWAFIPDKPPTTKNDNYDSQRIPIADWISRN